jgi:hypothetical protein
VHLEGTVRPRALLEIARRNGVALQAGTEAELAALYEFRDFAHFLDMWLVTTSAIRTDADFRQIVADYGREATAHGAVYLEAIFTPAERIGGGASWDEVFSGFCDGAELAGQESGIVVRLTPDIPRGIDPDAAVTTARYAIKYRDRGVVGLGLGGPEAAYPPELYVRAFKIAKEGGLASVPHAGEAAGPMSIRGALDSQLEGTSFGILCLTHENREKPWISFEAGALAKAIEVGRVVPLLLNLKVSDLTGPLAQFQAIDASNQEQFFDLMKALAQASAPPVIAEGRLRRTFDMFWPDLQAGMIEILGSNDNREVQNARSNRDILEEILVLGRRTERELTRVANMRVADSVMASRGRKAREPRSWWGPLTRAVIGELLLRIRPLGANVKSYIIDDDAMHVILDYNDGGQDGDSLRNEIVAIVEKYMVPIHVRGEPFGDETFFDVGRP